MPAPNRPLPLNPAPSGWVYVLTNAAMPGLVKIGCTGRTPEDRARELSDKTGVPMPYIVAWSHPVANWQTVEALTHDRLSSCRPNRNREFFRCSVAEARRAIEEAARAYLRPWWWRLVIGPRRRPVSRYRRPQWRRRGDPVISLIVAIMILASGVVAWLRPDPPHWLPPSMIRAVLTIERFHR